MKRIVLASQSPRRKEILGMIVEKFDVEVADVDETMDSNNLLVDEIQVVASRKASKILENNKDAIVIGSDTIVVIDNMRLGKPKDDEDAKRMLRMLSGRTHQVITGVCIMDSDKCVTFANVSDVTFDNMSEEEISDYVATKEPSDKAGSYAVQGLGARFINRISGDYFSIMGLPLHDVYKHLQQFN